MEPLIGQSLCTHCVWVLRNVYACEVYCVCCMLAYTVNIFFLFCDSYATYTVYTPSSGGHDDTNDADIKSLKYNKAMPQLVNLVV